GMAALYAAARSEDGRGPKTTLERDVPAHFGLDTPIAVAEAIHTKALSKRRVVELPPLVFAAADAGDAVATDIVDRLTAEIVAFVRTSLTRLGLTNEHVQVALGGGLARNMSLDSVRECMLDVGPNIEVRCTQAPPVLGAALSALGELGADSAAHDRVREELAH